MSGARTTSASSSLLGHQRPDALELRVVPGPAHRRGRVTSGRGAAAGSPCPSCQRDDGVAQHADPLDLRLDHVARPEVQRRRVGAEAGDAGDGAGREDVARAVAERRVVAEDLRDRHATSGSSATPAATRRSPAASSRGRAGRGSRRA